MHLPEGPQAALEPGWPIRVTLTWRPRVGLGFCSSIRTLHSGEQPPAGETEPWASSSLQPGAISREGRRYQKLGRGGDECLGPEGDRGGLLHYSL